MRNRTLHTLFLATLLTGSAIYGYAQDAQGLYSLEEVTPGGQKFFSNYYPKYIPRLQWIGDRCTYLEGDKLMESNAKEQNPKVLLTTSELQNLITGEDLLHMYHGQLPHYYPIEGQPSLLAVQTWRAIYIIDLSHYNSDFSCFEKSIDSIGCAIFSFIGKITFFISDKFIKILNVVLEELF